MSLINIGFCGTHGVGKTTTREDLCKLLSDKYGENQIRVIGSLTRRLADKGYKINKDADITSESLLIAELFDTLTQKESSQFCINDRTFVDMAAYTSYSVKEGKIIPEFDTMFRSILGWLMSAFDVVFFIPIEPFVMLEDDSHRLADKEYQVVIENNIKELLHQSGVVFTEITGSREQRADTCFKVVDSILEYKTRTISKMAELLDNDITPETTLEVPV